MAFYDLLKSKYLHDISTEKVEPASLQKVVETNLWPADYIELEGKIRHIYDTDIKISDILEFFKDRMPWIKIQLKNQELLDKNPEEMMAVKFVCFHQLAGLLSEVHSNFRKAFQRSGLVELQEVNNGPTIH